MRTRNKNTVSIVANSVDHVLNSISRACCKNDMLRPHGMNRIEVSIEE
jgi:hypothetical protein